MKAAVGNIGQWGNPRSSNITKVMTAVNGGCKAFLLGRIMTVPNESVPANFVPASAVIRKGLALFGQIGRKEF